ncbi:hypothetical protein [Alkalicoccobacillus plakortidis]|uniref:Uncharacterized protein n=1 Tax=Alkalicoccobacillus plakortidis TaxID=444060 RepID=A0ABT0XMD3_9BACI|nr:hypothetical protein [Alkalicoccobacillus plakortidis]MCM2676885.1 hypothetical protein [Alkalicoccobacillus plakortidis]
MRKKDQGIPYYDELSKLQMVFHLSIVWATPLLVYPFRETFMFVLATILIIFGFIPIVVTLFWNKEKQADSWCRVVAKRLRDSSLVFIISIVFVVVLFSFFSIDINFVFAGVLISVCFFSFVYFQILYRKMVRIQNVPLTLDAKKWREDLPRDSIFMLILVALIIIFIYFV